MLIYKDDIINDGRRFSPLVFNKIPDLTPGTIKYDDFWDEQDYRMLNGYKPEGMSFITGDHYFYLNALKINLLPPNAKRKDFKPPYYRELDRRLSYEFKNAKDNGYGLIIGKPRRVGLSWFSAKDATYELKFYLENKIGVAAGEQEKADDFYRKVKDLERYCLPEYKSSILLKSESHYKLGYKWRDNKQDIDDGLLSEMFLQTMFQNPSGFEGKTFSVTYFEEIGLFRNLIASYRATEPAFKDGGIQYGIPIMFGTGGEIDGTSKGYKKMWDTASFTKPKETTYNLKKVLILADEYYPGEDNSTAVTVNFFDYNTGRTNKEAARAHIIAMLDRTRNDMEGHIKVIQSYPLKESHIFQKTSGGVLDRILLNLQLQLLDDEDIPVKIEQGTYVWVDTPETEKLLLRAKDVKEKVKIRISRKSKVKFIEDKVHGLAFKIGNPINNDNSAHKPDIGGIDSYDETAIDGKGSLGAIVIYRTYSGPSNMYNFPVAFLAERGDSSNDDTFYENSIKMAVYWNVEILVEYSKIIIIKYFQDVGADMYLKNKPDLRNYVPNSRSSNEIGQRMTTEFKALGIRLLKAEIKENSSKYWFYDMLIDLIDFGDKNTDISSALIMCLLFKLEMFDYISDGIDEVDNELSVLNMSYYYVDDKGELQVGIYGVENDALQIETFNPAIHLEGDEFDKYKEVAQKRQDEKTDAEKKLDEIKEKYGEEYYKFLTLGKID